MRKDEIDKSAIDDDDGSSDWEDSVEDSGKYIIDEKNFFQRVDFRSSLPSRVSLITTMLHERGPENAFASKSTPEIYLSQSSPHNGPAPDSDNISPPMTKNPGQTPHAIRIQGYSQAQPFITANKPPLLGQHNLLWEQQKSQTANAVLKRRHTAYDIVNIKQYPERAYMKKDEDDKDATNSSRNQYFIQELGEYHAKGW